MARVLALLLVPVVVFGGPTGSAVAQTVEQPRVSYGPGEELEFGWDPGIPYADGDCKIPVYWVHNYPVEGSPSTRLQIRNARCSLGPGLFNDHYFTFIFSGATPEGVKCNVAYTTETFNVGDFFSHLSPAYSDAFCAMNEYCVQMKVDEYTARDETRAEFCGAVGIGGPSRTAPPDPDYNGACQWIKVTASPRLVESVISPGRAISATSTQQGYLAGYDYFEFRFDYKVSWVDNAPAPPNGYQLYMTPVYRDKSGGKYFYTVSGTNDGKTGMREGYNVGKLAYPYGSQLPGSFSTSNYESGRADAFRPGPYDFAGYSIQFTDSNTRQTRAGFTAASQCQFYFGEKFRNDPNSTEDDPAGPLKTGAGGAAPNPDGGGAVTDPGCDPTIPAGEEGACSSVPDRDKCGFKLTDPSTWASGGICMLVTMAISGLGILRNILSIMASLKELLDFEGLFVPSLENWGIAGLVDQFLSRPPGSVVFGVGAALKSTATAYGAASQASCTNLVRIPNPNGGADATIKCSSSASSGFSPLRALMQVALWSLTGWATLRIVMGAVRKGEE